MQQLLLLRTAFAQSQTAALDVRVDLPHRGAALCLVTVQCADIQVLSKRLTTAPLPCSEIGVISLGR